MSSWRNGWVTGLKTGHYKYLRNPQGLAGSSADYFTKAIYQDSHLLSIQTYLEKPGLARSEEDRALEEFGEEDLAGKGSGWSRVKSWASSFRTARRKAL